MGVRFSHPQPENRSRLPAAVFSGHSAVGSAPALGAGGREFESRHSDLKMHVSSLIIGVLFCFIGEIDERFLKVCKKCATTPQRFIDSP